MYGQRELFHSNLIAWFFEQLPEVADAVFCPLTTAGVGQRRTVDRERQHLDLAFHWPDRAPLVVENKVFALPDGAQLRSYAGLVAHWDPRPSLVLLALSPPDFDSGDWRYVSYAEFASRIREALPDTAEYEVETMRRYASLVADLHELMQVVEVRSDDEPVWLEDGAVTSISSSQMRSALQKARAQRVASVLNSTIPDLNRLAKGALSNATPLVEILESTQVGGREVLAGWQLQGNQFRRAIVVWGRGMEGRTADLKVRREVFAREHSELFTFPLGLAQKHAGRKEFNHFAPNFVYQYVKAPGLTIGELKAAALTIHREVRNLTDESVREAKVSK